MRPIALALLLAPTCAAAQHRFTTLAGAEAWNDANTPAHGYVQLTYDYTGLDAGDLRLTYNTDTLQVEFANVPVGGGATADARIKGEVVLSGLLPDYYVDGQTLPERGFNAHYVEGALGVNLPLKHHAFLRLETAGRRWFFGEGKETAAAFRYPDEAWTFTPALSYTWWRLQDDAAWRDPQRSFPRHRGFAVGLTAAAEARNQTSPWGAIDRDAFAAPDRRNRPEEVALLGRQWIRAGWQAHPRFRVQFEEQAAFGAGQDDLNRVRVGGLNPYTVPLAGAPWASYLPSSVISAALSTPIRVVADLELAPLVTAAVLSDPHRTGDEGEAGTLVGVGLVLDWRFGAWQVDGRFGWSPSVAEASDEPAWSALLAVGWST